MAGACERAKGFDEHPTVDGPERDAFIEHYELQPIDRQTNGPQLFYGLRHQTHIVKPGQTAPSAIRSGIGSGSRPPIWSPSR
jgi:hypothetical protein